MFYSTNKKSHKVNFETALFNGLAPDGGLYCPVQFPSFSKGEMKKLKGKSLKEIGELVLKKWLGDSLNSKEIINISKEALNFPIPIKSVGPYKILELFHGPTMAFKDIAARVLARIFDYYLAKNNLTATVLVATSGDTGGAVAQGFAGLKNIKVVILFPYNMVSKLQEEQLTRVSDNIIPIQIKGVFDDCQRFVKEAFLDPNLKDLNLTSANSINIGRLIPQLIYYIYAYSVLQSKKLEFVVPSGNMGNVTAGLYAQKMGLPFNSFIIAENKNDPVVKYYQSGIFKAQKTIPTLSNAMDIGNPSNFIRILELFGFDHNEFKKVIKAISIDDKLTIKVIQKVFEDYNYLLDPHTAVGWAAAEKLRNPNLETVILATASPIKFASEIKKTTNINIDDTFEIKKLKNLPKKKIIVENDYEKVKLAILNLFSFTRKQSINNIVR